MNRRENFFKLYLSVLELSKYINKKEIIFFNILPFIVFIFLLAEAGSVLSAGLFATSFAGTEDIELSAGILEKLVSPFNFFS